MVILFVLLADVIANGMWQMFLPLQCIATIGWLMLLSSGRWNSYMLLVCVQCCMGRCYCPVADGMATAGCECFPPDRCCSRGQMDKGNIFILILVPRCYAEPHPNYEADGTSLCSCLGMDYLPLCIMLL